MKLIEFPKMANPEEALQVLDDLRRDIEQGNIKAFVAVGISDDHIMHGYCGSAKYTTRLEMMGAMMGLQYSYMDGSM